MKMNDRRIRRYMWQTRSWLPCSRKMKDQIMGEIEDRAREFLEHNPQADFDSFLKEFGDPKSIAAAYVENTDTLEILKGLRVRRRVVTIVTVTAVTVLLTLAVTITWSIIRVRETTNAPYIEVVIE